MLINHKRYERCLLTNTTFPKLDGDTTMKSASHPTQPKITTIQRLRYKQLISDYAEVGMQTTLFILG